MEKSWKRLFFTIICFFILVPLVEASNVTNFSYTGKEQVFTVPETGLYKLEAWGASGGKNMYGGGYSSSSVKQPGYGAYTSGYTYLTKGTKMYIYVGGKGTDGKYQSVVPGGWNGGGTGDHDHGDDEAAGAGGGATDFRLVGGAWDNFDSLKSRIMVAAGGGGASDAYAGGAGGSLSGEATRFSLGGTQTTGYAFGKGMDGVYVHSNIDVAGGGSGYYGGYSNSYPSNGTPGAGGSSFVSGCSGCNAIAEKSTSSNIIHTGKSIHYSGIRFSDIVMKSGKESMPSTSGSSTMTGNSSNGYARITQISNGLFLNDISVNGVSLERKSLISNYDYILYLEPDDNKTGNIDLSFSGDVTNIMGNKNVSFTPKTSQDIIVTASDGRIYTYTVHFILNCSRLLQINFDYLTINNFESDTYEYTGSVPFSIKNLEPYIIAPADTTYTVKGNTNLVVGNNVIEIEVKTKNYEPVKYKITVTREEYVSTVSDEIHDFRYTGSVQTFKVSKSGYYQLEAWGAGGGRNLSQNGYTDSCSRLPGAGAYTKGRVYLEKDTTLYIYVGGKGTDGKYKVVVPGGWNGGGTGDWDHSDDESAGGGGGATDFRLVGGSWDNFDSLKSRIMVAGAGGGSAYSYEGGYGGDVVGGDTIYSKGGTQTTGYAFGKGMNGAYVHSNIDVGGGGSGYYGGYANSNPSSYKTSGAGGSSFVSGCSSCNAISKDSTSSNIIHTNNPNHYSGYVFDDITMIPGNQFVPDYATGENVVGNAGNGYARITYLNGDIELIDLEIENAVINEPITSGVYEYHVTIPHDNFTTNITPYLNGEGIVSGEGNVTLTIGKIHHLIIMDSRGSLVVYNLIPVLSHAKPINISFENINYSFNPSNYEYDLGTTSLEKLVPNVTIPNGYTYEVKGNLNLSYGDNEIEIVVSDGTNDSSYKYSIHRELITTPSVQTFTFTTRTSPYEFIAPKDGEYTLEAWGASGGKGAWDSTIYNGGRGAYTKGTITLKAGDKLYIYVGGKGTDHTDRTQQTKPGGYNGGGHGNIESYGQNQNTWGGGGGGATDFRLTNGAWNNFESLKSRIMVAGAGGGGTIQSKDTDAGINGGNYNKSGQTIYGYNGTFTYIQGAFGVGTDGPMTNYVGSGGGGGGYFGGGVHSSGSQGFGGTSYISGHTGVNSIAKSATSSNVTLSGSANHYSGKVFTDSVMKSGLEVMPTHDGTSTMTGNVGDGYAKITFSTDTDSKITDLSIYNENGDKLELNPTFKSNVYEYTVELSPEETSVKIDATANTTEALVLGKGTFDIKDGDVKTVSITDIVGNVTNYNITFTRELNGDKYLKDILINGISISEYTKRDFNPMETVYTIEVPYMFEYVHITGIKNNAFQKVLNDGVFVFDENTLDKEIVCVPEMPGQNQNYQIHIVRQKTSLLKGLHINTPGVNDMKFEKNKFDYDLELYNDILQLDLNAIPYYKGAKITITGNQFVKDKVTIISHVDGVEDSTYTLNISRTDTAELDKDFKVTGGSEMFIAPYSGYYRISLWGAAGGQGMTNGVLKYLGGEGAYTSGTILLATGDTLYLNVGGKGKASGTSGLYNGALGGYNGGGTGGNDTDKDSKSEPGAGGGGATDIRLIDGLWNTDASLRSRLMVAAGASGGAYYGLGVGAGGLTGYQPANTSTMATQISGYKLGEGQLGTSYYGGASGAGAGYYGGYSASSSYGYASGSGSSYISGHAGAIGTKEDGNPIKATYSNIEDSYNYSGKYFTDTVMIDGKGYKWTNKKEGLELMPNPEGGYFASGHGNPGDGVANIKLLNVISSNNFLSDLTVKTDDGKAIDFGFEPWIEEYDIHLENMSDINDKVLDIEAVAMDINAKIANLGIQDIAPSYIDDDGSLINPHVIIIPVTSTDGTVRNYILNVYRTPSSDPYPTDIKIKGMTSYLCRSISVGDKSYCNYVFDKDTDSYDIITPYAIKNLELNVTVDSKYKQVIFYKLVDGNPEEIGIYDYNILKDLEDDFDFTDTGILQTPKVAIDLDAGENVYLIDVIAEDGQSVMSYTYTITRDPDGNTDIETIDITSPTFTSEEYTFDALNYEYSLSVGKDVHEVLFDVKKSADNPNVTVDIRGNTNLRNGLNDCYITISAPNGEAKTYIFHIYKEVDTNIFLSSLMVKGTTSYSLSPYFDKYINDYIVNVPNSLKGIEISAIPESSNAVVEVNGIALTNDKTTIQLKSGINQINVTVINGDNRNIYKVNVVKTKSSNANLKNIEVKGYTLEEMKDGSSFNPNITDYHVIVPKSVRRLPLRTSLVVTPEESTTKVTVTGNNTLINNNNNIVITCVAEDGTKKVYNLFVAKDLSNNNNLKDIELSVGSLDKPVDDTTTDYKVIVDSSVDKINIKGIVDDKTATINGNGEYSLMTGDNIIMLVVTSESGNDKVYTITVTRDKSHDVSLEYIKNSRNNTIVQVDEFNYVLDVQYEIKKIDIEAKAHDDKATVSGNGTKNLNVGDNLVLITVTSEAGDVANYTLKIVRDKSYNDDLAYIFAKEGALDPIFKDTTIRYDVYVDNSVTSLTLDIECEDENATYEVFGNENFEVGSNEVTIVVTAPSGNQKTYTLNVHRQESTSDMPYLDDLVVYNWNMTPTFNRNTYIYEVSVPYEIDKVTLNGTSANYTVLNNGEYSLRVGKNALKVTAVNSEGIRKDYQVIVTRAKSNIATLDTLVIKSHVLSPTFAKDTTSYTVNTSLDNLEFTTINPTEADATYEILGNANFKTGSNTVTIRVTAPDGVTTKDYVLTVNKSPSNNNNLASLEVVDKVITPVFHKGTNVYGLTVGNEVNNILIRATSEDSNATMEIKLENAESAIASNKANVAGLVNLDAGTTRINIKVTSESNIDKTYTLIVTKRGNDNNYLQDLLVSDGELSPEFVKDVSNYAVTVPYEVEEIEITGEKEVTSSTVRGFDTYKLSVGTNIFNIDVTSEAGTRRTYTVVVTREELISNKLELLEVKNYSLDQTFSPDYNEYYINVPNEFTVNELKSLIHTATEDSKASVNINYPTDLSVGINDIAITVSRTGLDDNTYHLYINKQLSSNNKLKNLNVSEGVLSPEFNPDTVGYTVNVGNDVTNITITAEADDASAIVSGVGYKELQPGENIFTIKVTSILGIERDYQVKVVRTLSSDNKLNRLQVYYGSTILSLNPVFAPNTTDYEVTVPSDAKYINILADANHKSATVTGTGLKELTSNVNTFVVTVTAEDNTKKQYNITVNKEINSNATVTNITPSVGSFTQEFNSSIKEYTINLGPSDTFLEFNVETESPSVTITGNESKIIQTEDRVITVLAEDGVTKEEYLIHVIKEDYSEARLKSLTIAGISFDFNSDNFIYNLKLPITKTKLLESDITAVPMDPNATVNMMGDLNIIEGITNIYTIEVIARDGYTTQDYTLNIIVDDSDRGLLANLEVEGFTISPTFTKEELNYGLIVPSITDKVNIIASLADTRDTLSGTGEVTLNSARTTAQVVVRSNGKDTIYTITIVKETDDDNYLLTLNSDNGVFNPGFNPLNNSYTLNINSDVNKVNLSGTISNGASVTGFGEITILGKELNHNIIVTSPSGKVNTYQIKIVKELTSSTELISLTPSVGSIDYNNDTTYYEIEVPDDTSSISFNYQLKDMNASITGVNATPITDNETNIQIVVTGTDGSKRVINVKVIKESFANSGSLSNLEVEGYTINPTFDKKTLNYSVIVPNTTDKVNIIATKANNEDIVSGDGEVTLSGNITEASVVVRTTAGDEKTYKVTIVRETDDDNYLLTLNSDQGNLNPSFNPILNTYTLRVMGDITKVNLSGTISNNATVIGLGEVNITGKEIIHNIVVTSASGKVNSYQIKIVKELSSSTELIRLIPSAGSMNYNNDTTYYEIEVPKDTNSISFDYELKDKNATITGVNTTPINGLTDIEIVVTGSDGTKRVITVRVKKESTIAGIIPEEENITLVVTDTKELKYSFLPSEVIDASVEFEIADNTIISLTDKTITALKAGETTITIKSVDNPGVTAVVNVKVLDNKITSSILDVIRDVPPEECTFDTCPDIVIGEEPFIELTEFLKRFDNEETSLHVYDQDDNEITDMTTYTGSHMKLKLIINDNIYDELIVIVRGDIDGDGKISSVDTIGFVNLIYEIIDLDYIYLNIADVVDLDKRVSSVDLIYVVNYIYETINTLNPAT